MNITTAQAPTTLECWTGHSLAKWDCLRNDRRSVIMPPSETILQTPHLEGSLAAFQYFLHQITYLASVD